MNRQIDYSNLPLNSHRVYNDLAKIRGNDRFKSPKMISSRLFRHLSPFAAVCLTMFAMEQSASSQVVILPSYQTFSYSGSFSVPDSGSATVAGNSYSSSSSNTTGWGPYGPRSTGVSSGSSSMSVTAQIIDVRAMEQAMIERNTKSQAAPKPTPSKPSVTSTASADPGKVKPPRKKRDIGEPDPLMLKRFIADDQFQNTSQAKAAGEIRHYLDRAHQANLGGHFEAAKVYYRLAYRAMTPQMRARYETIMAELDAAEAAEEAKASSKPKDSTVRKSF